MDKHKKQKSTSTLNTPETLIAEIRDLLSEADHVCSSFDYMNCSLSDEDKEDIGIKLDAAYEKAMVLMEQLRLPDVRRRIEQHYEQVQKDPTATKYSSNMAELYLVWSYRLSQTLDAVSHLDHGTYGDVERVRVICEGFYRIAKSLEKARRDRRPPLKLDDEYDVQYLMGALLSAAFSDVRPEESTPSLAGKSSRMDFLLEDESIVVETKMLRDGLTDKVLGEQLVQDIARYEVHPKCNTLICFIYDPASALKNPAGLEKDLSKKGNFSVHVWVYPKR